jgi:hypothetical protein
MALLCCPQRTSLKRDESAIIEMDNPRDAHHHKLEIGASASAEKIDAAKLAAASHRSSLYSVMPLVADHGGDWALYIAISCRATPLPQSMTYAVLLLTMTCADAELTFLGRGPPPVPRRINLVVALCDLLELANAKALTNAPVIRRKPRLSTLARMCFTGTV